MIVVQTNATPYAQFRKPMGHLLLVVEHKLAALLQSGHTSFSESSFHSVRGSVVSIDVFHS